jgi:hypothetical protein
MIRGVQREPDARRLSRSGRTLCLITSPVAARRLFGTASHCQSRPTLQRRPEPVVKSFEVLNQALRPTKRQLGRAANACWIAMMEGEALASERRSILRSMGSRA